MNPLAKALLNVMRIEVLLGVGLVLWLTALSGCSTANHIDAALLGFEYVDSVDIDGNTYEVFRSEKQPNYFRAAMIMEGFCCTYDPQQYINNLHAIEAVSNCSVDAKIITHKGMTSEALVNCGNGGGS